ELRQASMLCGPAQPVSRMRQRSAQRRRDIRGLTLIIAPRPHLASVPRAVNRMASAAAACYRIGMSKQYRPVAIEARDAALRPSTIPAAFADRFRGREKRALGDAFGLTSFGVNLTRLKPGAQSALRHAHARQDEFVYI